MELVSVIIPVYNREKTIKKAIESVLNQTYDNIEVIAVDDCSSDRSVEVIQNINDKRVRVITCQNNAGACRARNIGIENAKGDFIAFQDSDDLWHSDKLEKNIRYIKERKVDGVFSALRRTENGREEIHPSYNLNEASDQFGRLLSFNCVSTQTIVVKREVCEVCRFDTMFPRFQDWDFSLQILKNGFSMYYIEEPLVECYVMGDSITVNHEKGKKALAVFDHKYKKDLSARPKYGSEFYFRAAVMMEKLGYNGKKYFKNAYMLNRNAGMYIRYLMSVLRVYRPVQQIVDKINATGKKGK